MTAFLGAFGIALLFLAHSHGSCYSSNNLHSYEAHVPSSWSDGLDVNSTTRHLQSDLDQLKVRQGSRKQQPASPESPPWPSPFHVCVPSYHHLASSSWVTIMMMVTCLMIMQSLLFCSVLLNGEGKYGASKVFTQECA